MRGPSAQRMGRKLIGGNILASGTVHIPAIENRDERRYFMMFMELRIAWQILYVMGRISICGLGEEYKRNQSIHFEDTKRIGGHPIL